MLTYYKLLQLHAKAPTIILPSESFTFWKDVQHNSLRTTSVVQGCELCSDPEDIHPSIMFHVYYIISGLFIFQQKENNDAMGKRYKRTHKAKTEQLERWVRHKYQVALTTITSNLFLSQDTKDAIVDIFHKTQRTYFALKKFIQIFRFKTAKTKIDTDLCLNPIDPSHKNTFVVIQSGGKYLFTISDVLNLTMTALMNSHDFFAEPRFPKNPYTNVAFTKTDMYNIYFRVVETRFITPPLFTECFLNHFELENFLIDNEAKLRHISIRNYVMHSPHTILYAEIKYMIRSYFKGTRVVEYRTRVTRNHRIVRRSVPIAIDIHPEFPRDVLVNVMRPYLYLFLLVQDHIQGTEKRTIARALLKLRAHQFLKFNHNFGRKILSPEPFGGENPFVANPVPRSLVASFNDKHETFTVQQAEELFTTRVLMLRPEDDGITIVEGEPDDSDDDILRNDTETILQAPRVVSRRVTGAETTMSLVETDSAGVAQSSFISNTSTALLSWNTGVAMHGNDPGANLNDNGHIGLAVFYNDWGYIPPFVDPDDSIVVDGSTDTQTDNDANAELWGIMLLMDASSILTGEQPTGQSPEGAQP